MRQLRKGRFREDLVSTIASGFSFEDPVGVWGPSFVLGLCL